MFGMKDLKYHATTVTCFLPLSTPPLPISLYLLPPSLFSLLHLPPPPPPPSLLSLSSSIYHSFSITHSVSYLTFNILQYFSYLDHSLLPHSTMLFTVLSCVFNISHYFLLFRSLGVIHKGSTKHTSQLPTATEVWAGASGPQDEGSKRNQQPTVERRFHGEGTTVKDKKTLPPKHMEKRD